MKAAPASTYSLNTANLDGTNDYFSLGDVLDASTNDFAIAFWVKVPSGLSTSSFGLVNKANISGSEDGYNVRLSNGQILFETADSATGRSYVRGNTDLRDDSWHFVRCQRNSGGIDIYIDTVVETYNLTSNKTTVRDVDSTASFYIGYGLGAASFGAYFQGGLSFVGIAIGDDLSAEDSELYNGGNPPAWGIISGATQAKFSSFWNLCDNGSTEFPVADRLTDQAGANTLTNNGTTPFNGTGLSGEA